MSPAQSGRHFSAPANEAGEVISGERQIAPLRQPPETKQLHRIDDFLSVGVGNIVSVWLKGEEHLAKIVLAEPARPVIPERLRALFFPRFAPTMLDNHPWLRGCKLELELANGEVRVFSDGMFSSREREPHGRTATAEESAQWGDSHPERAIERW